MDRIERLRERIEKLEKEEHRTAIIHSNDKPILASAIRFLAFVILFTAGLILHWHWGWLIAIGIVGIGVSFNYDEI